MVDTIWGLAEGNMPPYMLTILTTTTLPSYFFLDGTSLNAILDLKSSIMRINAVMIQNQCVREYVHQWMERLMQTSLKVASTR
jgi:hypothetical protein